MRCTRTSALSVIAILIGLMLVVSAAPELVDWETRQLTAEKLAQLKTETPMSGNVEIADIDASLLSARGTEEVIVRLRSPSVAMANCESEAERVSHKRKLQEKQSDFMERTSTSLSSVKQLASVHILLNAVFLEIDAKELSNLAADPDVASIHRVKNYGIYQSETVPYIGATTVRINGFDGTGIRIAILDSGIDYTHAALGGEGTVEAYTAAYADFSSRDGLFPTAKVIEGYDFVGEFWPNGTLLPDDDPIDLWGHGTAVADIAAGLDGVAHGASLYAVKVCSAIGEQCSGIALMQGMDYAMDPNGDGDTSDAVDVINLSLGESYGQPFDDDLSQAIEAATALGVLTVAAAGNAGDKPYIVSTPSSTLSALSVAQTQAPWASISQLTVGDYNYPAVYQPWSRPLCGMAVTGSIQYGDGAGGNLYGCEDFATGSLAGKFVLLDDGVCRLTEKVSKISLAGGVAGIIGLVAPGLPSARNDSGSGGPIYIPAYTISQADSTAIKAAEGSLAILDPINELSLVRQMFPGSGRGPQLQEATIIKPEIGAPGPSAAAYAGSGTGIISFGGTSGASPLVTGSAALLLQAFPILTPAEVKARLMNNGETNIDNSWDKVLAPISRIGGGEVRVDRALAAPAAAWDNDTLQAALSFGFIDVDKELHRLYKTILIRNYSNEDITYTITPTYRYEDDANTGAVVIALNFPGQVKVVAGQDRSVSIMMTIVGALLPDNFMNSGSMGGGPAIALTKNEYDGYIILDDGTHPIHLPWHVLPRKAANIVGEEELNFTIANPIMINLENTGMGIAQIDSYSLLALSSDIPQGGPGQEQPTPDIKAVGIRTLEVGAGVCSQDSASFIWAFAISTWSRQQHLYPVRFEVVLDTNQDGTADYIVLNSDFLGVYRPNENVPQDGRQVTQVVNLSSGDVRGFFFTEHSMNTGNTVLFFCAEQIGMTREDLLKTNVDVRVFAKDNVFGGAGDSIEGLTVTPGGERYFAETVDIGPTWRGSIKLSDFGAFDGNSDELGVMLFTNGDRGSGKRGGATQGTELKLLLVA